MTTGPRWLFAALLSILPFFSLTLQAADSVDGSAFFESRIRPVLVKHCYECHSDQSDIVQAGLRLDHRDAMLGGGDSGAAVVPGDPEASLLVRAMKYEDTEMPPSGPLDERIIRDFEKWIRQGAIDPRKPAKSDAPTDSSEPGMIDWDQERQFWAFQTPVPSTRSIDRFVSDELDSMGLSMNPPADRRTLIRRLSFDLTGLPPTPEQVQQFVDDRQPGSIDRVINRFLSDPALGEHWARLWLDVARYAEDQAHKVGNNDSLIYPNAYLYRDWVINAISNDLPYDDFVRLQLAADHFRPDDPESHLALGFLGLGPKYYRRNSPEVMADEWEDRVDTVSRGLLGLTVACARCHDHKYDPIPTSDYYALAGVFASTEMFNRPLSEDVKEKNGQAEKPQDAVHIVRDGKPVDLHVMIRGDVERKGDLAPRKFLSILSPEEPLLLNSQSGRADLAEAIVDPDNPLAARVIVNRIWRKLMGQGLIETPSNFGTLGERPSHPELLDALASRLIQNDWSLKQLIREIVRSNVYQQSSQSRDDGMQLDAANRFYWRMSPKRLSIESYRDTVLLVCGSLEQRVGGRSVQPDSPDATRKTLYSEVSRMDLNPMLARFGFPDPNAHCAKRAEVTTPLQKLFLLNSPFMQRQARSLAERLVAESSSNDQRIISAYQVLLGRSPSDPELQLGKDFVATGTGMGDPIGRWTQYAHMLLISNEMQFVD